MLCCVSGSGWFLFRHPIVVFGLVLLLFGCQEERKPAFVDDRAALLSPVQVVRLNGYHRQRLEDLDMEFRLTLLAQSPGDLEQATSLAGETENGLNRIIQYLIIIFCCKMAVAIVG